MSSQTVSELRQILKNKEELKEIIDPFSNVDLPAHPKVLDLELAETEDYLSYLYSKLIFSRTVNGVRKNIVQNTYDDISEEELASAATSRTSQKNIVEELKKELEQLQDSIFSLAGSIETDKNTIIATQEEATQRIHDITKMESRVAEIDELVSHKLEYTADEAKKLMDKLTEEMLEVMAVNETKHELCVEKSTKVDELETEVAKLKAKRDIYKEEAMLASNSYQVADKSTDEKYQGYKKCTDLICRIAGVEEIITESNGDLKVIYALPYDTELIISFDEEKVKLVSAKTTGNIIHIQDLVEVAKNVNVYNGVEMVIRETLFRLKNRIQM